MSFTLLTLPNVSLRTQTTSDIGTLSVECLSDSQDTQGGSLEQDVTLAFHLNAHTVLLERGSPVLLVIAPSGQRTYSFQPLASSGEKGGESDKKASTSSVQLVIPPPKSAGPFMAEDIETFDHLLVQYADLSWAYGDPDSPPPLPPRSRPASPPEVHANIMANVREAKPIADPALRGRLVLMDDANGDVIGELPQSLNITEDPALVGADRSASAAPVVLELHPDMYDACTGVKELGAEGDDLLEVREVFARVVPMEEQDWIMKSATLVSQAISGSTSLLLSGITTVSNYYIAHSAPGTPTPSHSGAASPSLPSTAQGSPEQPSTPGSTLERVYALSGQVAKTSSRTADAVEGVIRRAVGGKPKTTSSTSTPATLIPGTTSEVSTSFPPAYAVYTPKHRSPRSPAQTEKNREKEEEDANANTGNGDEKKPLKTTHRLLLSANLVLTTIDDSARRMFEVGSDRLGAVVGHKFGPDAQRSTHLATHTARNVVLVYVDVRGFARRALITKTGKEFVKARFGSGNGKKPASTKSAPTSGSATPNLPGAIPGAVASEKS